MAFVDITTPKSPVAVAVPLLQCRAGKRVFTPEVCQEVLQSTNFAKNIRDMLVMISELPVEKQAVFKDVVLSTFDRREQPNDIVVLGKKLAVAGGYEAELNGVDKIGDVKGEYLFSGVGKRAGIVINEFERWADYSKYEEVFALPGTINVGEIMFGEVRLRECDLSSVKKLRFKDGVCGDLTYAKNLPAGLDVSMCDEIILSGCDLSPVKNLRFKKGSVVYLRDAKKLPEDLDVSVCDEVDLCRCDLSPVKNLRFKDNAQVDLSFTSGFSGDLDFSMCGEVYLRGCDVSKVKNLRFKNRKQEEESGLKVLGKRVTYSEDASFLSGLMGNVRW